MKWEKRIQLFNKSKKIAESAMQTQKITDDKIC